MSARVWTGLARIGAICTTLVAIPLAATAQPREPVVAPEVLTAMAELCEATEMAPTAQIIAQAMAAGWTPVGDVQAELTAFRTERDAGQAQGLIGSTVRAVLGEVEPADALNEPDVLYFFTWPRTGVLIGPHVLYFNGPADAVAVIHAPGPVGMINDISFGAAHHCYFYGYGWLGSDQIAAGLSSVFGDAFENLDDATEGVAAVEFFLEAGPPPVARMAILRSEGDAGARPTFEYQHVVVHDTILPDNVRAEWLGDAPEAARRARIAEQRDEIIGRLETAFDVCTSHTPNLDDRVALMEAAGWPERVLQGPVYRNGLLNTMMPALIGRALLETDSPGSAVERAARFAEFLLDDRGRPETVRAYRWVIGDFAVAVLLLGPGSSHPRESCYIFANFDAPVPELLAGREPRETQGDVVDIVRSIHGPLGAAQGRDDAPLAVRIDLRMTTSAVARDFPAMRIGPFAVFETVSSYIDAEWLDIFSDRIDPDPRGQN